MKIRSYIELIFFITNLSLTLSFSFRVSVVYLEKQQQQSHPLVKGKSISFTFIHSFDEMKNFIILSFVFTLLNFHSPFFLFISLSFSCKDTKNIFVLVYVVFTRKFSEKIGENLPQFSLTLTVISEK
jgi:hypothetical protein